MGMLINMAESRPLHSTEAPSIFTIRCMVLSIESCCGRFALKVHAQLLELEGALAGVAG
eukprot:CAMPEP_0202892940 /NCGR_PEP_ID=MMETSP1392-20130828/2602_1 /ASSEMBLY_ACC=CAM_ASM_000868 /TAXON_ID=225041 /ORGANISM="Chlamydomonas chlamydogama, Strain SAG 11-48b" /LENGTH=58 /DNA_ID=CAMNT_0049577079 /DNA_START=2243 /DNA_END=2419 /DNA_ORIENTATION=+